MISRGISRRALRWSNLLFVLIILVAAAVQAAAQQLPPAEQLPSPERLESGPVAAGGALFAQAPAANAPTTNETPPLGILLTRPEFRRGIDFLPANTIPHWAAEYQLELDGESRRVRLFYVEAALALPQEWERAACSVRSMRVSPAGVYYYQGSDAWSLLIAPVHDDADPDDIGLLPVPCSFTDHFVSRFLFFQSVVQSRGTQSSSRPPEFPAIVTSEP